MKGKTCIGFMPASPWDMSNWFNWFWWMPGDQADITEDSQQENIDSTQNNSIDSPQDETIDTIDDEIFPKTETKSEKPKPKRKKRTVPKKVSTKSQDAIELILRPSILEELEKEAIITDSTLNQVIQVILEAHIESKSTTNIQTEVWKCNFCQPDKEFKDYFEFSEHFFSQHMQPGLQKISEYKVE